jgi:hypothetical protein
VEATAETRSPLETGARVALAALAFAGVVGTLAVLSADSDTGALGVGVGLGMAVFLKARPSQLRSRALLEVVRCRSRSWGSARRGPPWT